MPVDYSKWDALELSDDSDVEVHPNVDKRSFIRAKQNQIHQQRFERKHRITTLKYERVVNDGLLSRIDGLLASLERHRNDVEGKKASSEVDEVVFDCLLEVSGYTSLGEDMPPTPPQGVHTREQDISYSKMMAALVDQVKAEIEKLKVEGSSRYDTYVTEVRGHQQKVVDLQKDLNKELQKLEKEDSGKITSESIHTGFDSSHVSKATLPLPTTAAKSSEPELLNPSHAKATAGEAQSHPSAPGQDEDEDFEASPLAKRFGNIGFGEYNTSLQFISQHPEVLNEKETDGLLAEAFTAQSRVAEGNSRKKDEEYSRQCVHQALLLQYCRQLGKDGVGLFFKRIQTKGHQARKLFLDDVNSTYARIRTRTAELAKEKADDATGDREQIQLHAVDPNTTITIVTPPSMAECQNDDEKASREIFESLPPSMQRALETGDLAKVNLVLGKMSVEEAEKIVDQLGNGGMLSMEEGVIDATTDEGKKMMEEIERSHHMPSKGDGQKMAEVADMD